MTKVYILISYKRSKGRDYTAPNISLNIFVCGQITEQQAKALGSMPNVHTQPVGIL